MRIDAREGHYYDWHVYHVPECRMLKWVVWCDDVLNQYATHPMNPPAPYPLQIHQARKVEIHPARKLVLIDPIEDAEPGAVDVVRAVAEPA